MELDGLVLLVTLINYTLAIMLVNPSLHAVEFFAERFADNRCRQTSLILTLFAAVDITILTLGATASPFSPILFGLSLGSLETLVLVVFISSYTQINNQRVNNV